MHDLRESLQWLVKTRWIGIVGVCIATIIIHFIGVIEIPLVPILFIVITIVIYNYYFQKTVNTSTNLEKNAISQIVCDYLMLSLAVFFSGGSKSPFIYYFVLHVVISGILLPRRWVFSFVAFAVFVNIMLMFINPSEVLPGFTIQSFQEGDMSNAMFSAAHSIIFITVIFFTAYLITHLSDALNRKREIEKKIFSLSEKLRSTILLKDVVAILMESLEQTEGVRKIVFFYGDKKNTSLVYMHNTDIFSDIKPDFVIPMLDQNMFTDTFFSCIACPFDADTSTSPFETEFINKYLTGAKQLIALPVWSSFGAKCYEHFQCGHRSCPVFDIDDVRCWNFQTTLCRAGMPIEDEHDKLSHCLNCEQFMPLGVLVCDITTHNSQSSVNIDVLINILNAASLAISNAKLYERTLELSELDSLTGIRNRRSFFKTLQTEFTRVKRYIKKFSILMIDIDYFKKYNDANGHPQGDVLLRMVSDTFQKSLRETDIIGRYGGEEFIVLMPETGKEEAIIIAERLRISVDTTSFPMATSQPEGKITVSIGVSCYPDDTEDLDELIGKADSELYRAKKTGRNRVCYHTFPK